MLRAAVTLAVGCLLLGACTGESPPDVPSAPTPESTSTVATGDVCAGQSLQELEVDGTSRWHLVSAPESWDGTSRLPIVYHFHGLGGQADTALAYTGFAERVEELGFIVVAPQAIQSGSRWDYRTPVDDEGSDLSYMRQLMDAMTREDCADADRQYVAGMSNGSAFAFAMACSGEFAVQAYGGVAAAFHEPECDQAPAASIVYFHGTADTVVPFNGGPTPLEPVAPAAQTLTRWAEHAQCESVAESERIGEDVERFRWPACADQPVEAYVIEDGAHTWPGAAPITTMGGTTQTIDATDVMLEFFDIAD